MRYGGFGCGDTGDDSVLGSRRERGEQLTSVGSVLKVTRRHPGLWLVFSPTRYGKMIVIQVAYNDKT